MRLFDNYLTELDGVLSKRIKVTPSMINEQRKFSTKLNKSIDTNLLIGNAVETPAIIEGPKVLFDYDKNFLNKYFGANPYAFSDITIGPHPDFKNLGDSNYINHHCVSVFVDIKGSTRLIEKYSLLEVRLIKDSLLTLAIQVANQFGGHVHRLQGDGIFLQFVRRDAIQNDAIINALNATAILSQFVSVDLASMLRQYDIRPLKIRVGIDYGENDKVLWSYYGIPGCNELTTTSLHTDMAAKLQAKAFDNSILIGGYVKTTLDLKREFYSIYENTENKEKVYYISRQFTYPFFVFNWKEYLLTFPFVWKSSDGDTLEIRENSNSLECFVSDDDNLNKTRHFPNSISIPKGKQIIYQMKRGNSPYIKQNYERIEWYIRNSGKEARDNESLNLDLNKLYLNKNYCETTAAYLGHHYVECKIIRDHSPTEKLTFPIFVQ